jgi:4-amino-4-deoxy-L-arabinose transferase-like glycosyltransferase
MSAPAIDQPRLRGMDYLLLTAVSALLLGYALIESRSLTMHESVLPQNSREMMIDHDWLIPKYGFQPWLERPPLPQWITVGFAALVGHCDREWIVRAPVVALGIVVVLLTSWMTSLWYGRNIAVISGLVLATMWEFYTYSSDSEADMYLCAIVTGAVALFAYLEFCRRSKIEDRGSRIEDGKSILDPQSSILEPVGFFAGRSWLVLAFFVLFGMTNLAKGLIFGTLMVAVPVACFLFWNLDLTRMRRYIWLWGWLAFAVVSLTWPVLIWEKYPDVLELWASDYIGRLNQGFIREPVWYYAVTLPWVMLPWTGVAIYGLWRTAAAAFKQRYSPERFLWCWAVLTPVIFSIPQGKHHHYLLQCLAPWAVLTALGAVRIWEVVKQAPLWLQNPALSLLTVALPADLALALLRNKIPGPAWVLPLLLVAVPVGVFLLHWGITRQNGRVALVAVFTVLTLMYCGQYSYKTHFMDRYADDTAFLEQTRELVPGDKMIYVNYDQHTLEGFRTLFYLDSNTSLLRNLTYLRDEKIKEAEVYVLARGRNLADLSAYGTVKTVLQSKHTRGEATPDDRWTLFFLRFREDLVRRPADLYIRPMQASGRAPGPFLE